MAGNRKRLGLWLGLVAVAIIAVYSVLRFSRSDSDPPSLQAPNPLAASQQPRPLRPTEPVNPLPLREPTPAELALQKPSITAHFLNTAATANAAAANPGGDHVPTSRR
jgi:hypothetical protein